MIDGLYVDFIQTECVNPDPLAWDSWRSNEPPSQDWADAREQTATMMAGARDLIDWAMPTGNNLP